MRRWPVEPCALAAAVLLFVLRPTPENSVTFLDVGQGDCILVQMMGYKEPLPGDIVAIKAKDRAGKHLVKRIIATGGDTVQIDFEAGAVFVNGQRLEDMVRELAREAALEAVSQLLG